MILSFYKVKYKSSEDGSKPEEFFIPGQEDPDMSICTFLIDVRKAAYGSQV